MMKCNNNATIYNTNYTGITEQHGLTLINKQAPKLTGTVQLYAQNKELQQLEYETKKAAMSRRGQAWMYV